MADGRFFTNAGPFSLSQLAEIASATLPEGVDGTQLIDDVAPLSAAGQTHLSFLENRKYTADFEKTTAGACLVHPGLADRAPTGVVTLLTAEPYRAYALCAQAFYPAAEPAPGIAASATVDPTAEIGAGTEIGAGAVVGQAVQIGEGCVIGSGAVISAGVTLGAQSRIGANATLACCDIGARAIIHTGVRIGQDGFGFAMGPGGHLKVPQLGRVQIGNDVEIGANTTIDRGTGPDTVIGDGCKIDNLVQIGHNVRLGRGCVIVALVGIAGSTELGDFVVVGGQAGIAGHLKIGMGARIAAHSGVMRNLEPGATVGGAPAIPMPTFMRQVALLAKLARGKDDKKNSK
ncbi:MAG: UDP-3-O-(3-hydroxymyristoyl)glucosamine N-acyltransferase [Magnetospiraceae bacterium]